MKKTRKTLSVRHYKAGYETRTEEIEYEGFDPFVMKVAYTPNGDYIGNARVAHTLCKKMGLAPEPISPEHNICSIGFCEREQKWYGWSHRAMYGFGVGSITKPGDCGYVPNDVATLAKEHAEWNDTVKIIDDATIEISNTYINHPAIPIPDLNDNEVVAPEETPAPQTESTECYTVEIGRGEWVAKSLDDAKEMAIDFANDVA